MDQIKIGVGVILWRNNEILLGRRLSPHGTDQWSFPGGHVEFGESPEQAAIREVREETALKIAHLQKLHFTNDIFENGNQYITLFYVAREWHGEIQNMEPEKCAGWEWFDPNNLPIPLFQPILSLMNECQLVVPLKPDNHL